MLKGIALTVLSLCLILAMTGVVLSQDAPSKAPTTPTMPKEAPKGKRLLGEVV